MIKRIIGILFVVATVVVIIFTAIGAGSYESMLSDDLFRRSKSEVVEQPQPDVQAVAESVDSLAVEGEDGAAADVADDVADDVAAADTDEQ